MNQLSCIPLRDITGRIEKKVCSRNTRHPDSSEDIKEWGLGGGRKKSEDTYTESDGRFREEIEINKTKLK